LRDRVRPGGDRAGSRSQRFRHRPGETDERPSTWSGAAVGDVQRSLNVSQNRKKFRQGNERGADEVGLGALELLERDLPAGPGLILDQDTHTEVLLHVRRDAAGLGVLAAAGVGGHDDLDGFLRERALGGAAQAGDGQRRGAADDRAEECASHGPFLTTAASIVASGIMWWSLPRGAAASDAEPHWSGPASGEPPSVAVG